jgi:prepilin-type processing-associated H-X9-DG protein
MKMFTRALLCFLLLTISRGYAQETFAPLLTENTVAFVHVDFSKVELDTVKETAQKAGEDFLRMLGFDDRSFQATARELSVELEKLDMLVRPTFNTITKELGIRELAIIFDMEILETNRGGGIVAVPWKNKTDKQFETLKKFLIDTLDAPPPVVDSFFKAGEFLILPLADQHSAEMVQEMVKGWLAKETPKESPILEALKSVSDKEIKCVVAIPEQARGMINSLPFPPDVPVEVRNFLSFAAQKIEWASTGVSLSPILGTEAPENADVLLTVKTPQKRDADMLRSMLESLIEYGVNFAQFAVMQESRGNDVQIPPLAFQFAKGFLRTLLPDVEEDKLIFRLKGNFGSVITTHTTVSVVGAAAALLLPAVQTSREAARRMQCSNHIKQITLAIHNYHDATGNLPPLYTVDANGKPLHSWRVLILPYLEQQALYDEIMSRPNEPWDSENNKRLHAMTPSVYRCPTNPNAGCVYSGIAGEGFVPATKTNSRGEHTFARITDGTSNTIAIIEIKEPFNWMDPTADITLDELVKGINVGRAGSFHPGGCNAALFDGSVRFISNTIDPATLRALGTCAGGETVGY